MCRVLFVQQSRKRERKSAFTLIELLVVIAIISILASILFPVFARARENARRTTCLSNLKQINLGMMQYTQDNDERYPVYVYFNTTETPGVVSPGPANGGQWYPSSTSTYWFWQNMIYPYVKSVQVFICPSSPIAGADFRVPTGIYGPYMQNYGVNDAIVRTGRWGAAGNHTNIVVAPAKTYLFAESSNYVTQWQHADGPVTSNNDYLPGICKLFPTSTATNKDCWNGRHFDGVNVGFADGHVKWLKTQTLSAEALKTDRGSWNPANS